MKMENIEKLMELLPEGYQKKCLELNVIQRSRAIKNPEDLMKLCLIYLSQSCSLLEVSEWARALGIAQISDVAFMKKFMKCKWILEHLTVEPIIQYEKPEKLKAYRLVAVDASNVSEKGATKRKFKLHYGLDLLTLSGSSYKLTTEKTGESLRNFSIQPYDLVIADRAYGTRTSILYALESEADFIFRMKHKSFKLYDQNNQVIQVASFLQTVSKTQASDLVVYMEGAKKERIPLRLCALKKTEEAIETTQKKLRLKESKRQKKFSEETKLVNQYLMVLTSLPPSLSPNEILEIYRLRWQVELYFKRLKSILNFGDLPKKKEESMLAWLNGKLRVALLIEKLMAQAVFPPKDDQTRSEEYLARSEMGVQSFDQPFSESRSNHE
jgi:Transposase DDE domain